MANIEENPSTPVCMFCDHYTPKSSRWCSAFKEAPNEILTGENDHSKPLPDQRNNIVFEPIKD